MMSTRKSTRAAIAFCAAVATLSDAYVPSTFLSSTTTRAATFRKRPSPSINQNRLNMVYAPPGSGYLDHEDETSVYPDSYDPMMEYPGTMRPGKTKENQAFENLPLADTDPDPVPWPHFQEIEWHHLWEPPHPHSTPMEEFIEQQGRWASAEEEAQMRMEVRRGVRERRELEEMEKSGVQTLIVDTDEDDDEEEEEPQLELGQGVGDLLGGDGGAKAAAEDDEDDVEDDEGDDTDFLLDLGLDVDDGTDDDDDDDGDEIASSDDGGADEILDALSGILGMESDDDDVGTATTAQDGADIDLDIDMDDFDDDDDVDLDDDDDDDVTMVGGDSSDGFDTVPLEDYGESEDMGEEDDFDDGGFDWGES